MTELNLTAPINNLGYGQVGWNFLREFDKLGVRVNLFPITGDLRYLHANNPPERLDLINKCWKNQDDYNPVAPSLRVWHQFDLAQHVGFPRTALPIFELDKFTQRELHHLASQDRIFVCSKWAQDVVVSQLAGLMLSDADNAAEKIANSWRSTTHVVPLGVDPSIFYFKKRDPGGPYIFLNIGKWEYRKGHDVICQAFNQAFDENDDVELWMMNHNPFLTPEETKSWHDYYLKSKLGSKVKLFPRVQTQLEVAKLMEQSCCGVYPARAEGWNLELLEHMAIGRPVITVNYSAHTEYCDSDNSFLVEPAGLEEAFDGTPFFRGQGNWACLDNAAIDQLAGHMRHCYKDRIISNDAGVETGKKLTWENSVRTLGRILYEQS